MTLVKCTRVNIYGGKLTTGKTFYHGVCNGTYCYAFTASVMYHFWSEKRLQLFQILFAPPPPSPQNHSDWDFQNPVFDLIRRIHKESVFNGFMIRFWICPKKRKIQFWIRKSWFFPPKTHSKYRRFREGSFAAHSRFYAWFPRLFDCNITVGAATPLTSKNSLVTKKVPCFGVLLSLFLITESNASITDWSQCLFRSGPCCILHLLLQ